MRQVDLRSDTVTLPSNAMRAAIAAAELGDDVLDGDPTTRRLEAIVAARLGKEAALFFPTGTMANQAALCAQCRPGTEVIVDAEAHMLHMEMAGAAANAGVQVRAVRAAETAMTAADLTAAIRPPSRYRPRAALIWIENSHNGAGGVITPLEEMLLMQEIARSHALPVHLDGARLWNVAAATGHSLGTLAAVADTVMVSFAKGLGAPAGAVLAGDAAVMEEAWFARKRLGGGMRQSGILAAACLYGLEHNVARLRVDHDNARLLAGLLAREEGCRVVPPDTNIVMLDLPPGVDAYEVEERCAAEGIRIAAWHRTRLRLVTHLDVSRDDVATAAGIVAEVLRSLQRGRAADAAGQPVTELS